MTELEPEVLRPGRLESLQKLFHDLFSSPVDAFDFYGNTNILHSWHIFFFHFSLWIYAPLAKLLFNIILIKFFVNPDENTLQFTDGLIVPISVYPVLYILGWILESFRRSFKEVNLIEGNSYGGIGNISFLAISSTSIFWILPKPINFVFLVIGILYSIKLYYNAILSFDNFSRIDFYKLFMYYFILLGSISVVLIIIGNSIRGNS